VLVWISDCFTALGLTAHAKRYLMLTLCEDAMNSKGVVSPSQHGVYFRLVWQHGLTDAQVQQYAAKLYALSVELEKVDPTALLFPEALLLRLDEDWVTEVPAPTEVGVYRINSHFARHLFGRLGDRQGKTLEELAHYLMSAMPGCRTMRRKHTPSTDYDLVCAIEGFDLDFRSELGRYFVCECKDWARPADFTTMAKFCRVLDSTKSRFGILFSKEGISGRGDAKDAAREQIKVYQDRGIVIVVIDAKDLETVVNGANFIALLRRRYEKVRLDLDDE
jgi:hypothetical protein